MDVWSGHSLFAIPYMACCPALNPQYLPSPFPAPLPCPSVFPPHAPHTTSEWWLRRASEAAKVNALQAGTAVAWHTCRAAHDAAVNLSGDVMRIGVLFGSASTAYTRTKLTFGKRAAAARRHRVRDLRRVGRLPIPYSDVVPCILMDLRSGDARPTAQLRPVALGGDHRSSTRRWGRAAHLPRVSFPFSLSQVHDKEA